MAHSNADLTLVTSPQMKEELENNGVERVAVWRKGIDTVRFNPSFKSRTARERLTDGNPDSTLLVYVGRLGREKRLTDLRAALDANPSCRLALVGKAAEPAYLEELKRELEPTGRVVFTGQLGGDELSEAFAAAGEWVAWFFLLGGQAGRTSADAGHERGRGRLEPLPAPGPGGGGF